MIRQPASENSFTVAWPIPRDAPVNTMVFCSEDCRGTCEGNPGNRQRTVFFSADPGFDRGSGSALSISTVMTTLRRSQRVMSGISRHSRICTIWAKPMKRYHRGEVAGSRGARNGFEALDTAKCQCSDIRVIYGTKRNMVSPDIEPTSVNPGAYGPQGSRRPPRACRTLAAKARHDQLSPSPILPI